MSEETRDFPDFNAGFFSLSRLRPLLDSEGAVLLRRLLPAGVLRPWSETFALAWEKTEQKFAAGELSQADIDNYYTFGHPLPGLIEGFELWFQMLFAQLPLRTLLRTLFGPEVFIMGSYSLVRVQRPTRPQQAMPFHQDYEYIGEVRQAVNVWIPVTPAGGDAPGLELELGGAQQPVYSLTQSEPQRRARIDRIPAERLWRPQMQPGDVLIFTPYTLHRTSLLPGMSQNRVSAELRICAGADRPFTLSSLHSREV